MKKISLVMFSAMCLVFNSCEKLNGDGPVVNEMRNIVNFSGIDLRVSADVYFKQDSVYKVEVSAQRNVLQAMETFVSGNKLVIKFKNNINVRTHDPIMVIVSAPSANSLRVTSSGNISVTGNLTPASMELDISGSGNIQIPQLTTGYLDASISGSGNISVSGGDATEQKLKISGSGNIDLVNVLSNKTNTTTTGSGNIKINVSQNLDVKITGSGSVFYKNNPIVNTSITGSGKVIHI